MCYLQLVVRVDSWDIVGWISIIQTSRMTGAFIVATVWAIPKLIANTSTSGFRKGFVYVIISGEACLMSIGVTSVTMFSGRTCAAVLASWITWSTVFLAAVSAPVVIALAAFASNPNCVLNACNAVISTRTCTEVTCVSAVASILLSAGIAIVGFFADANSMTIALGIWLTIFTVCPLWS